MLIIILDAKSEKNIDKTHVLNISTLIESI